MSRREFSLYSAMSFFRLFLVTAILLWRCGIVDAQDKGPTVRNIVLVHGAGPMAQAGKLFTISW
jgi:hypothetical protein